MRRLAVVAMALTATCAMAGCQPEASDSGSSGGRTTVGYEDWQPVYRQVRPATETDLEELRDRVHELNASSYTAALEYLGAEIASTPEHVRVRFFEGSSGEFDLHLNPQHAAKEDLRPFVVCFASTGGCVQVGEAASSGGAPHLFNDMVDGVVFMLAEVVGTQLTIADKLSVGGATYATIDSPSGKLDCLVDGGTAEEKADLEGQPVELNPDPVIRRGEPPPVFPFCVDQHGLVVVVPSLLAPIAPYSSFESGVEAGIDEHPAPVPYGETPTPSPSPTPSETEPPDPDEPQQVLVATGMVEAGESLRSAMQAGKLQLDSLPRHSVLPGALTSVTGLEDHVALLEVPAGGQITADNFRIPTTADLRALSVTPALYDAVRRVAARNGYGESPGAAPTRREMLVLAYRFAHRCELVASGTISWRNAPIADLSGDSPSYDQALRLNEFLETGWCPSVLE